MFLRSLDELTKHTSLKQWDPFLNYWSWNLGTELICKSMLRDSFYERRSRRLRRLQDTWSGVNPVRICVATPQPDSISGLFLDSVGHANSVDEESNTLIEFRSTRNEWCG